MTSLNPSLRLALISKAKGKKNIFQKGFTLVELMVTVAIVGLLSAVAVPQFLSFQADAKGRSAFIEAIGLAKECATARSVERLYPEAYPAALKAGSDPVVSGDCTSGTTADVTFKSALGGRKDMKCGTETLTADGSRCQIVVTNEGKQTFSLI